MPGVALERLDGRRVPDVPHDGTPVLARGDGGVPVRAEGHFTGEEIEEAHRAVATAEQQRAIVGAKGRLLRAGRQPPQGAQCAGIADHGRTALGGRHHAPAVARDR